MLTVTLAICAVLTARLNAADIEYANSGESDQGETAGSGGALLTSTLKSHSATPSRWPLGQREAHLRAPRARKEGKNTQGRWASGQRPRRHCWAVGTGPTVQCGIWCVRVQEDEGEICLRMRRRPARPAGLLMVSWRMGRTQAQCGVRRSGRPMRGGSRTRPTGLLRGARSERSAEGQDATEACTAPKTARGAGGGAS